ncbi:MAG: TMEM165/GDT1 family protein [Elusimicrobiota bacterium]|nr:TMEM165/GDT1 family protein [Elusimicrobiota bacterium]
MDWRVVLTTFTTLFLAELGDKTQLAAMSLSSATKKPLSVFVGGTAALAVVTGIGVLFGDALLKAVPAIVVRRGAAALFVGMGVWMWFHGD